MNTEVIAMNDLLDGVYPVNHIHGYDFHTICNGEVTAQWQPSDTIIELRQTKRDRLIAVLPIIRNEIYVITSDVHYRGQYEVGESTYDIRDLTVADTYWYRLFWVLGLDPKQELKNTLRTSVVATDCLFNQISIVRSNDPEKPSFIKEGLMPKDRLIEILRSIIFNDKAVLGHYPGYNVAPVVRRASILLEMLVNGNIVRKIRY